MEISPSSSPEQTTPTRVATMPETPRTSRSHEPDLTTEPVDVVVKYDFGWDKRGSGFKYDSHSGRGSLIGNQTNKVLGYSVLSSYCSMCARGLKPDNHVCAKNYEGSAKGMEPKAAVDLCLKNPDLDNAGVRVKKLIGDRDSSTMAALRRESRHEIHKIIDINHNTKSVNNALWKLKKEKHRFLTTDTINYLKRCVAYAIKRNAGNVEAVRNAILNIENHTFGEHGACGDWCRAKGNPNYPLKFLPDKRSFSDPVWRQDLRTVLQSQADDANELATAVSTLQNESFNHMCNASAPKSKHYCGTQANLFRVSAAVCCKNLGAHSSVEKVLTKAQLSPSVGAHTRKLQSIREVRARRQSLPEVKKRHLSLKMKSSIRETASSAAEGLTYVSEMSTAMERAAEATRVSSWLPEPSQLLPNCKLVSVDIETTGLSASADVVQLAATCSTQRFSAFMEPGSAFSPQASGVTGIRVKEGRLLQHGQVLETVPAEDVCKQFMDFLRLCAPQVILVVHNIIRFDAPRIIRLLQQHGLAKDFCSLVFGFTDTLPLIKQGKVGKIEVLAKTYLQGSWTAALKNAHDALTASFLMDC